MFSPPLCWAALRPACPGALRATARAGVVEDGEGSSPTLAPERMGESLKGEGDTHQEPELPALRLTFPPARAVERAGSGLNRRFSLWLIAQGQMRFLQDRQRHVVLGCFYSDNPTPSPTLSSRHPSKAFWGDRAAWPSSPLMRDSDITFLALLLTCLWAAPPCPQLWCFGQQSTKMPRLILDFQMLT